MEIGMTRTTILLAIIALVLAQGRQAKAQDCNNNSIPDTTDIANMTSADCNINGTPDECEVAVKIIDAAGDGAGNVFELPRDIAVDAAGNVYVAGNNSHNAFKITPTGVITEIIDATGDGTGNGLAGATDIVVDGAGNVYVGGFSSNNAFKITPGGVITQIIDATGDGAGNGLDSANGIAVDGVGNIYVAGFWSHNTFKITPAGVITEIIDITGVGMANSFAGANGIAIDDAGNVYVAGQFTDNAFKITPAGVITEIIDATGDGSGNGFDSPWDIAVDDTGNVYVAGFFSDNAFKITPDGVITELIDATGDGVGNGLDGPVGIAVDNAENVYVTGEFNDNVFKITPTGVIIQIMDATGGGVGNPLDAPEGVTVDAAGNVYVAGAGSNNVFKIAPDCNNNGISDGCDISAGMSQDIIGAGALPDGIPDECQLDCNGNLIPDELDIAGGTSQDCNSNGIPDECDIAGDTSPDCNANGIPDECDLADQFHITFTKIVDTSDAIPGGTGNFTGFRVAPSLDGGDVAFTGFGVSLQQGDYTKIGGLFDVVADRNTLIPGGTGNFTSFGNPAINSGHVAFLGFDPSSLDGIYTDLGGSLNVVADTNTAFPGGTGNFTGFLGVAQLKAGKVAFRGDGSSSQTGIFMGVPGALNVIADTNSAIPGGTGNFKGFGPTGGSVATFDGTRVAFKGFDSSDQNGVYTGSGGPVSLVADQNTPIPGRTGTFTNFGNGAIGAGNVAFRAHGSSGQSGIYSDIGGLNVIADTNTLIPKGSGTFTLLTGPNLDQGNVAFHGSGASGQEGIYADFGGGLFKVVDLNDMLDGKSIIDLVIALNALSGDQIVFWTQFADGSQAIYLATMTSVDCNGNGVPDTCEIDVNSTAPGGPFSCTVGCDPDCNNNGIPDACDIANCQGDPACGDCNNNGIPDSCDIASMLSNDVADNMTGLALSGGDGIPDECINWSDGALNDTGWNNVANWEGTVIPGTVNSANVESAGINLDGTIVDLNVPASVDSLILGVNSTLNISMADLTIESPNGIQNEGIFNIGDGFSLIAASMMTITGLQPINMTGPTARISSAMLGDTLTSQVTIRGQGIIDADFVNDAAGSVIATSGGMLQIAGSFPKVNNGLMEASDFAILALDAAMQNNGLISAVQSGIVQIDAPITGSGSYVADQFGTIEFRADITGTPGANVSFTVTGGTMIIIADPGPVTVDGCGPIIVRTGSASLFTVDNASLIHASSWTIGDTITGPDRATMELLNGSTGLVNGPVTVKQNGTLRIIDSSLTATDLILEPGANLQVGSILALSGSFTNNKIDGTSSGAPCSSCVPCSWCWAAGSTLTMSGGQNASMDPASLTGWATLEAAGTDNGPTPTGGDDNFGLAVISLTAGAHVSLVDFNANGVSSSPEAVYGEALSLAPDAVLNLNDLALYIAGALVSDGDNQFGGMIVDMSRLLPGDLNNDGQFDEGDMPGFIAVLIGQDTDPARTAAADLNNDTFTDGRDIQAFVDQIILP